jgi:hypothetical protein
MDLVEIGCRCKGSINVDQDRDKWTALVNAAMKLWIAQSAGKLSRRFTNDGLSSSSRLHITG